MFHGPGVQVVAIGAGGRPGAAADHGGDAGHQRFVDLLRADEMDVGVDAAGGDDQPSPAMTSVPAPMTMVDAGLDVRIAGLADAGDAAVLDADVGLDDAAGVEDQRVGDHDIDALRPRRAGPGPCRRG